MRRVSPINLFGPLSWPQNQQNYFNFRFHPFVILNIIATRADVNILVLLPLVLCGRRLNKVFHTTRISIYCTIKLISETYT